MKKVIFALLCTLLAVGNVQADSSTAVVNVDWTTGATGLVATAAFAIGDADSIDSIEINISHTWASDLIITLDSAVNGESLSVVAGQDGSADLGVNAADGTLGNVAQYIFAFDGSGTGWDGSADGTLGGDPNNGANSASSGPYLADTWILNVTDQFGGDQGAISTVTVNYTPTVIPEPAAGLVLCIAGLGLARRRR